ncbi:MAG: hypothetical protein V3V99_12870 [candidate division Zixibacteria bacterium]
MRNESIRKLLFVLCAVLYLAVPGFADEPKSMEEAKALSKQTGKPLLLEFYRDD